MRAIRAIKGGQTVEPGMLEEVMADLHEGGARAIVLGCTELSLARTSAAPMLVIDSTQALAEACVRLHLSGRLSARFAAPGPLS